ncbi:MAG: hypothetical protein KIC77_05070 [Clostridiales bacterium]|nr:hypothetical protein [Clostridiales bacterium]
MMCIYSNTPSLAWSYVNRDKSDRTLVLRVNLTAGERYKVVLFGDCGYNELKRQYFDCP